MSVLDNNKTAVILASRPVSAGMRRYLPPAGTGRLVISADAGWHNAEVLGLWVEVAVGDFDSAPPPPGPAELVRLPAEKDETDTHHAARLALARGCGRVLLLGAAGGRLDHTLANLHTLLFLAGAGAECLMADEGCEVRCMGPGRLALPAQPGRWLSVFAAGGPAAGVYLRGVKYPLTDATLQPDWALGVSNEFAANEASIICGEGFLFVMTCEEAGDRAPDFGAEIGLTQGVDRAPDIRANTPEAP